MAISRRHFFFGSLLAGAVPRGGFGSTPSLKLMGYKSPNEKLNIASIGAGGKAASDIRACADTENIVALCDVDDKNAAAIYKAFEKPPKYRDFRKMLDKEAKGVDAVIVTIPDFMHAVAAMACMERGKHVYVQKPLTRTVWEARMLTEAAQKYKVATQMGNQGYSNEGTRQCAEMIWNGEIGDVKTVYAWTNRPIWPQGLTEIPKSTPVPETLDWDLWLGCAQTRPYTAGGEGYPAGFANGNFYNPANWRGFYDFGCGSLGDMACHILGAANMSLKLGAPTSVECIHKEGPSDFMFPKGMSIKFEFPARGSMPPVTIIWSDAQKEAPNVPGLPAGELIGDMPTMRAPGTGRGQGRGQGQGQGQAAQGAAPAAGRGGNGGPNAPSPFVGPVFNYEQFATQLQAAKEAGVDVKSAPNGSLFIGDKGMITTGTYGENTRLIPVEKMKDYHNAPEMLTRSPAGVRAQNAHYRDWIRACKGGEASCSNFNVAGPFTEWIVMAVISTRVEGKLEWDPVKMRFTNNNEANKYIKPFYRKGWAPNWKG
jgi:predicted dehydrogenase